MFRDQKTVFRSYETLLESVLRHRNRLGVDHLCQPRFRSMVIEPSLYSEANPSKPKIALFDYDGEPFFDRRTFSINAHIELWKEAGEGEPLACFKLLHELAHARLHRHPHHGFTTADKSLLRIAQDEESSEWQANVFAALSMAPPYLAIECNTRRSFHERFNFPSEFTDFWFALRAKRPIRFAHRLCSKCGSDRVASIGSLLRCVDCGLIA